MAVETSQVAQQRLGLLLARHGQFVNIQIRKAMADTGLTPRHREVLVELAEGGATSQQALLERLSVDPSVLVGILNDLERQGLAERRRDPSDRRRHIVEMSDKGCEALRAIECAVSLAEAQLFADWDDAEREQLHALLNRVRMVPDEAACTEQY